VLEDARRHGFLGPGPVADQLQIGLAMGVVLDRVLVEAPSSTDPGGMAAAPSSPGADRAVASRIPDWPEPPAETEVVDLGAGGGVPGLVIAAAWPGRRWTLLDAQKRRVRFLVAAIERLGLEQRVDVIGERAEVVGHDPAHRERYAAAVARGFASPSATAEMAAPLVRLGGRVLVSEPPGSVGERWPAGPLQELGLVRRRVPPRIPPLRELCRELPCPAWAPRRIGVPGKRPRF